MSTGSLRSARSYRSSSWQSWDFLHRRRSSHDSTGSSSVSQPNSYGMSPQVIAGARIDEGKLQQLLDDKFDGNYKLHLRSNKYKLYTANGERLTREEIMGCRDYR
ncbi:hypothetical protein F5Y04DRAFT_196391 [Hypomontagnella monticulosa]|nr:hypothetical protein F5Y04DRAFT_196391 [Hypomontagnella monticulosa]